MNKKYAMILFPNAKINIGLNVTEKRLDGYHSIETVFYPIPLTDVLEIIPDKSTHMDLQITGIELDHPKGSNLVEKAWQKLHDQYEIQGCKALLNKIIPFGAGLGGGSSDASFCLKGLSELNNLDLSNEELENIAASIGADCPFFIENTPQYATGIGNILTPIDFSLAGKYIVLVKPNMEVSTKEAYDGITPKAAEHSISLIKAMPLKDWKHVIKNDFETPVFKKYPVIRDLKTKLYDLGAVYASMSGSGSAVYGIYDNKPDLTNAFDPAYFVFEKQL